MRPTRVSIPSAGRVAMCRRARSFRRDGFSFDGRPPGFARVQKDLPQGEVRCLSPCLAGRGAADFVPAFRPRMARWLPPSANPSISKRNRVRRRRKQWQSVERRSLADQRELWSNTLWGQGGSLLRSGFAGRADGSLDPSPGGESRPPKGLNITQFVHADHVAVYPAPRSAARCRRRGARGGRP